MPVEVLYAVDGTTDNADSDDDVYKFEQSYWGVDRTDKHYYDGPGQGGFDIAITGGDSRHIVTNVENQIRADYTAALQRLRRLVIDMLGFSRGTVIVGTVALDLNTVNLTPTGFTIQVGARFSTSTFTGSACLTR